MRNRGIRRESRFILSREERLKKEEMIRERLKGEKLSKKQGGTETKKQEGKVISSYRVSLDLLHQNIRATRIGYLFGLFDWLFIG